MIGSIDVKVHAASPQIPLAPVFSFVCSPSNLRIIDAPRKIGDWRITAVRVQVQAPDNTIKTYAATLVGGAWVATLDGSTASGRVTNGVTIYADCPDSTGYVLGRGDLVILAADSTVTVGETAYPLRFFDAQPETPRKGDACFIGGVLKWYDGAEWQTLGADTSGFARKGDVLYVRSKVVDGVQHYVAQTMTYDDEMGAWGADWSGDYVLSSDGSFIPAN